jgi:hypothetical protein
MGIRQLDALKWGLVPHFTKDLKEARKPINARAETVATSGMFRGAFAARRCIVPAGLFYEWQKVGTAKQPYAIARADEAPLAFGGIWEGWRSPDKTVDALQRDERAARSDAAGARGGRLAPMAGRGRRRCRGAAATGPRRHAEGVAGIAACQQPAKQRRELDRADEDDCRGRRTEPGLEAGRHDDCRKCRSPCCPIWRRVSITGWKLLLRAEQAPDELSRERGGEAAAHGRQGGLVPARMEAGITSRGWSLPRSRCSCFVLFS